MDRTRGSSDSGEEHVALPPAMTWCEYLEPGAPLLACTRNTEEEEEEEARTQKCKQEMFLSDSSGGLHDGITHACWVL
ncbi:hypothetical protein INR49_015328 [Caranx melampygus]|nr:hypothetical protein INR49_015328 [Caranx melampygus]